MNRRSFLHTSALCAGALSLAPLAWAQPRSSRRQDPDLEGLVAFRVGTEQWMPPERFDGLLDFFRHCPGTADEVAFFTSGTHPPLPLPEVQRRADMLARLMPRVRETGPRVGINLLATMGHHEENLPGSLNEPWPRVVDPHGRESRGSYCPASPEFKTYVAAVYEALTQARPDFLWIDDDVRLAGHMPIGYTCFCPGCLSRFSARSGEAFTRESLLARFQSGDGEQRLAWRRRWLEHNRETLNDLFRLIEQTVHRLAPRMPLGFMTGDRFYEGYAFGRWATTLAGPGNAPVRWRPGGGFYSDESLTGLPGKAHDIGRQVAQLPAQVTVIQSEIENFPYDLLRKSARATVIEAAAHMATGTTGTAFNVLSQRPDPLDEYIPMLEAIHQAKPFYAALRKSLGRAPLAGVWPVWNADVFAANSPDGAWPEGPGDAVGGMTRTQVLSELGIPLCYGPQQAVVSALSGPAPLAFTREQLREIFARGVLMDVSAWHFLQRLGLAGWTGVKPGAERPRDAIEVLANHPLNRRFAGWSRDCRQSFWHEPATSLEPTAADVETLARMIDYGGNDLGVSMTAFTNELGGRVVVMGYFPWSMLHHWAKSSQMKAVCSWLSQGRLPAVVESFNRIHLWVREPAPGRLACVLLNASLDPARSNVLRLVGTHRRLEFRTLDGQAATLKGTPYQGGTRVKLPDLPAWSVALVTG